METVSGTDTSPSSTSIESELTLLSQSIEQLRQDKMENRERVENLEQRIAHLEAVCSNQTNLEATVLLLGGFSWGHETSVTVLGDTECKVSDIPLHRLYYSASDGELVCGGSAYSTGHDPTKECYRFVGQSLEYHSSMNKKREALSMASIPGKGVYVFGGKGDSIFDYSETTFEFLPTGSQDWTNGTSRIPVQKSYASCAVALNTTHILLAGGYQSRDVRVLDVTTDTWTNWPDLPYLMYYHSCIKTEDGVLLAGGLNQNPFMGGFSVLMDIRNGETEVVGTLNVPRQNHKIVEYKGKVMAVGGSDRKGRQVDLIEEWIPETKLWVNSTLTLDPKRAAFVVVYSTTDVCLE